MTINLFKVDLITAIFSSNLELKAILTVNIDFTSLLYFQFQFRDFEKNFMKIWIFLLFLMNYFNFDKLSCVVSFSTFFISF